MRKFNVFRRRIICSCKEDSRRKIHLSIVFVLSIFFIFWVYFFPGERQEKLAKEMRLAALTMAEALESVKKCRIIKEIPLEPEVDPNLTGIIGIKHSSITTTLGQLEAKRTTSNPNFAALMVYLFHRAGVTAGDEVVIGASASFPSLILAVLSAAKAMKVKPLSIYSLGASQWGANIPEMNWLKIYSCLRKAGIFDFEPVAVSLGGEKDTAGGISEEGKAFLLEEIKKSEIPFIQEPDLKRNIQERLRLYRYFSKNPDGIKAFVNIGGSYANLGTDSAVLEIKPGLVEPDIPTASLRKGMIFSMMEQGIPVIHLLYIKGLCRQYGLLWDPLPLPRPGESLLFKRILYRGTFFKMISGFYLALVLLILAASFWPKKHSSS